MKIKGTVALVTGANRGLGRHFAEQLLQRGAGKVYAAARTPGAAIPDGAQPLVLDVTDPASIAAAARAAPDVQILINNAGICTGNNFLDGDLAAIRSEMEVHYFGTLMMTRAFAPVLARNGGGAVINILSGLSWYSLDGVNSYCAAKAAEWSLSNGLRVELLRQNTMLATVHLGAAETDMTAGWNTVRANPADIVRTALDGFEQGALEVLADETARNTKARLSADVTVMYPQTARGGAA